MPQPIRHIAVYGSLKQAFPIQKMLGITQMWSLVGPCSLKGKLYDMGEYPAMIQGKDNIAGELYEILDERLLGLLDEYEGYDPREPASSLYLRRSMSMPAYGLQAWIYLFQQDISSARYIPEGIWEPR